MNVPYSWLRDLVAIDLPVAELTRQMTSAGLEAEKVEQIGAEWDQVYVGHVVRVERHPDADRLVLATVEAGEHQLTVVTGAPNIAEGQNVALALAGANLIDAYSDVPGKRKVLKPGKIRGILSEGMVCSERELGLSDEHEGILVLPDDAPVGATLQSYLGDEVIEFEITPNLVHAFSMYGIAREAGALNDVSPSLPAVYDLSTAPTTSGLVTIEATDLCPRYTGVIIDGVSVAPSPTWMSRRLTAAGLRPVNNIVDITNYVMLELGQPLHAFDLRNIAGERIIVRRATAGETIETLDHTTRQLTPDNLLITDADKPVAVAGVMGGVNSEVTDDTTSVLLESANFTMVSVRHTARQLKLRTDASARYERGLDPELVGIASRRAVQLITEICPGATVRCWEDDYPAPPQERALSMAVSQFEALLGRPVSEADIVAILGRLEFSPTITDGQLSVTIPTWRSDVSLPQDIIEEVARIIGYDHLPATLPVGETPDVERDPLFRMERRIRTTLAAVGAYEARSYVVTSEADAETWTSEASGGLVLPISPERLVRLKNPMNAEQPLLRTSLIPSLVRDTGINLRHERTVRLFEIGHVYLGTSPEQQPQEPTFVGIVFAGLRDSFDRWHPRPTLQSGLDIFDLKGTVDLMLRRLGFRDVGWQTAGHQALHPGRTAEILVDGTRVGMIGELRPDVAADNNIDDTRVVIAELSVTQLLELATTQAPVQVKVDRFLPVEQDFAIVVDEATPAQAVEVALRRNAGPLLTDVTLFDVFVGAQLGKGKKSLAYRLTFTAPDRALTDAELVKQRKKIEKGVHALVGGEIRS